MIFATLVVFAASCGGGDGSKAGSENVPGLASQTSTGKDVSVTVAPEISSSDSPLNFKISISGGAVEENTDVLASAVLVDDNGKEYQPVGYEGDPPGPNQREVTLKFDPITPFPKTVTLKLHGVGGVGERSYSWALETPR